jgi:hypothetical protein
MAARVGKTMEAFSSLACLANAKNTARMTGYKG